ncbi:DUF2259 domain-containing protein [Pantanalinema rosaneae CENA516]|uniref:DUF2259 domain-containing protein n=1 Tax=Pantanalinema rosaneae TaxID=1620701 RepID=UPI003D6FE81B
MLKRINQTLRWCSPALVFLLLSACSSATPPDSATADAPRSVTEVNAPTDPQPSVSPVPQTETAAPVESSSGDANPGAQAEQSTDRTTTSQPPARPATTQPAPAAPAQPQPPVASDSLKPTFRTRERMAGFSADGDHFIYLESSRDTGAGIPKSTMQVVALASNDCVKSGCVRTRYGEPDSDLSLEAAENSLLQQTWSMRQRLQLTPPTAGQSLPVLSRSRTADGTETMTVRLANNQPLQLRLQQKRIPATQVGQEFTKDRAAMQLEITYNGQRRSLGSLNQFRDWVLDYSIRDVKLSPDGKHLVVLVTAMEPTFEGTLATTIVQGFEL